MKRKQVLLVGALILATLLVSGVALAQDGGAQSPLDPAEALTAAASAPLSTGFTYQGRLDEDGSPVNDACDMSFRLYDAASMGAEVASDFHAGVPVNDGLFSVNLDFGAGAFTGDRRWLEIKVDCEEDGTYADLGRQELTAAPYALGLKPGAVVSGTVDSVAMLSAYNSGSGYGVLGLSGSSVGVAGQSDSSYGVYAYSDSGYGIYAYGGAGDLRLYDGTIYANMWSNSDLKLHSNDNADVHLDDDGNSISQFRIFNGANTPVFTATETGAIRSTADTQIAVSPLKMVARFDAGNLEFRSHGSYMEVRTSSAPVTSYAHVPVDLPSVLFETPIKLKSIRVCYRCTDSASYISRVQVGRASDSGGYAAVIDDDTNRDSTIWDCYTITDPTPGEIQGSLFVIVRMYFDGTGSSHNIRIGNITLTLTEQ